MEPFQSRFVSDQRADDIAIFRRVLLPDDHKVTIQDAVLDHAVALNFKGKCFFAAREFTGDRKKSFNVPLREYRRARSHTTNNGNLFSFGECRPSRLTNDLNCTLA